MDNICEKSPTCSCFVCKNYIPFTMPMEIVEATIKGELVIFAGAGISTESPLAFKTTLYQDIKDELNISKGETISFSELMSLYCDYPDGKRKLYQKILKRLDYTKAFQEIYYYSTRFHRELSTLHFIREIITTNWDDFFEKECGAIPIVNPKDFVFWDLPQRKVFKIHGCANNFSSIVVTKKDYEISFKALSSGLIGNYLKLLLATKKVVFVGYSFGDENFNQLYSLLFEEMEGLVPHAYIVTLDTNLGNRLQSKHFTPIVTDAAYFISELKKHVVQMGLMLSDDVFERVPGLLEEVLDVHTLLYGNIDIKNYPLLVYTLCYQDGMIHAFQRINNMKRTGEYSCPGCLRRLINSYIDIKRDYIRAKSYTDVAYIDGYIEGLYVLLLEENQISEVNPYYIYGYKYVINTLKEFLQLLKSKQVFHKTAYEIALNIVETENKVHHRPFL